MGRDAFAANAFASNFMTGFSFVDAIKQRQKSEKRLEARLKEEKQARLFEKGRVQERDRQVRENRAFVVEDRARVAEDRIKASDVRDKREKGERAALKPGSSNEELLAFAPFSPGAATELKRRIGQDRFNQALRTAQTVPRAGTQVPDSGTQQPQSLSDVATSVPNAQSPSGPAQQDVIDPNQPSGISEQQPAGFRFSADRGQSSLQTVTRGELNRGTQQTKEQGFFGNLGEGIASVTSGVVRSAEDVVAAAVNAPGRIREGLTGNEFDTVAQNPIDELTGVLRVSAAEFTDADEFAELEAAGDNAGIRDATERNNKLAADLEARGENAGSFDLGKINLGAFSRAGRQAEGSEQVRKQAIAEENKVVKVAEDFLDNSSTSVLENLAIDNPKAATVAYLDMRATLEGANPDMALVMDNRFVPVFEEAGAQMVEELLSLPPGTAEYGRKRKAITNLADSVDMMARQQPSASQRADIKAPGLKVGDTERVNAVVETMFDPNQLTPTSHSADTIKAASTTAGRISSTRKRLNEVQINALSTLVQAGWLDKPTALSVMMTGTWPAGKDPQGIAKIQAAGGVVYAFHNDDSVSVLPSVKKGKGRFDRSLNDQSIDWALQGIGTYGELDVNRQRQAQGLLLDNIGWIRANYSLGNQESMMAAGRAIGQSFELSRLKKKAFKEDSFWSFTNPKDVLTGEQLFLNPSIRDEYAAEFKMKPIAVPPIGDPDEFDLEPFRAAIADGKVGGANAAELSDQAADMSMEELATIWFYENATPEQIAAAAAAAGQ